MAKKPDAIVQVKLRIRERLRRRLTEAAKKRGVAVNYEMMSRLERSFEQESIRALDEIAPDIQLNWLRFGERFLGLGLTNEIIQELVKNVDPKVASLAAAWLKTQEESAKLMARLSKEIKP
jgi:hypothetical protein